MAIKATCGSCGKQISVRDDAAGKRAKCPDCGAAIPIPAAAEDDIWDAEEHEDDDANAPKLPAKKSLETTAGDRKPCPECGEMIVKTAAKCRFCGEIFDPALKKAKRKLADETGEEMSTGDWVVAVLCSGIGCIAGIVWMIQGKTKGPKMLGVSVAFMFLWGAIRAILVSMAQHR